MPRIKNTDQKVGKDYNKNYDRVFNNRRGVTMKVDWCKILGHKWAPMYIKGNYNKIEVKFIACYCKRCYKGYDEAIDAIQKQTICEYNTYQEKYFNQGG